MKENLVAKAVSILKRSDYAVSDCRSVRSCFDILARRGKTVLLIKALVNIEGITPKTAAELREVSSALSGVALVLGEHMKNSALSPGVIYTRYDVHVVNIEAFEEILSRNTPTVYSIRGNYCVRVDASLLAGIRKRGDMTQEELAAELGISKQSIHRYESTGRVSREIAEKLMALLNENIAMPGEVLTSDHERPIRDESLRGTSSFHTELEKTVFHVMRKIGLETCLTNAPFDILAIERERHEMILTIVSDDHRGLKKKVEIIRDISEITGCLPVCVSNRSCSLEVPVIKPRELSELRDACEFMRLIG